MKKHLTGAEVAKLLGVAPATIRAWRSRGQGPPYSQPAGMGTQATYDPDVVDLYVKSGFGAKRRKSNVERQEH